MNAQRKTEPTLLDRLRAQLSPETFHELCENVRALDPSFFRDVMLVDMKPVTVSWDHVDDPQEANVVDLSAVREDREEHRIDRLVRETKAALGKHLPERLRRWVVLRVLADGLGD
jgi:hypothetical protein